MKKIYLLILPLAFGLLSYSHAQSKKTLNIPNGTPVVDGLIDPAYGDISLNLLTNNLSSTEGCTSPAGGINPNITTVGAVWNVDSLYVIMNVKDATPNGREDAAEIFITIEPVSTPCEDFTGGIYFNKNVGLTSEQIFYSKTGNNARGAMNNVKEFAYKSTNTANGYIFEASIALADLAFLLDGSKTFEPAIGTIIGIDFANANDNPAGGKFQSMWNQCCGNRNWARKEDYGIGKFVGMVNGVGTANSVSSINKITVYPNPATSAINVKINAKDEDNVSVSIINSLSQKVYSDNQAITAGETIHTISTNNLSNGIYTVVISKGNSNTTQMVVINK